MKKFVYIVSWIVLGLLLGFIAHALIEMSYINRALASGIVLHNQMLFVQGYCFLPIWLQGLLIVSGIVGGYLAGRFFWRVLYVEGRNRKIKRG